MIDDFYTLRKRTVTNNQGEKEEVMILQDVRGGILDVETAKDWLVKAGRFYFENDNAENIVERENNYHLLSEFFPYNKATGFFSLLPVIVKGRKVREDLKRNWGFTCPWCGEKWSTKKGDVTYFWARTEEDSMILMRESEENTGLHLFCSEDCGHSYVMSEQKQALHERGLLKYFDV